MKNGFLSLLLIASLGYAPSYATEPAHAAAKTHSAAETAAVIPSHSPAPKEEKKAEPQHGHASAPSAASGHHAVAAGIPADKLTEPFEFSTQLAWFFHSKNSRELPENELREFNDSFSEKYHPGDFALRIESLIASKILIKRGNYLAFRYPYVYYFLIGRFISQKLNDKEIRSFVTNCCKHLYVRENANTILFLAHFTTDEFVIDAIAGALHSLFLDFTPLTFSEDTKLVASVIENAPILTYTGEKPEEHRKRVGELRDDLDDGGDGLQDSEEAGSHLSLVAQLTVLFKTIEILGQILKNQYARIERPRKVELISEIFSGPLRALHSFFAAFEKHPDYLVAEIDAALEKRGKLSDPEVRQRIAKRVVGHIVQAMSFGFTQKAGAAVSGDALRVSVSDSVRENGSLAFRLIESSLILDSPAPLPRSLLKALLEDSKNDVVAIRTLSLQLLHHMYMFKTSETDKQWLASQEGLHINLTQQHAIEYTTSRTKKLGA